MKIKPNIGAHVSVAGGLHTCFERARLIGSQSIQIFGASPRQWSVNQPTRTQVEKYNNESLLYPEIMPVVLHAAYLVNLASSNPELYKKSIENLSAHLQIAESLGALGLIFHLGSFKGWSREQAMTQQVEGMLSVLSQVQGNSYLIMENSAGGGDKLGTTIEDISHMLKMANHERVKICIDTQHSFASGMIRSYTIDGVNDFVTECENSFGWDNIVCLHVNDSKAAHGSCVDRHENIGEGVIGVDGFSVLAKNPLFSKLPWILEVPGFDDAGPDRENVERLKKLFI